MPGALAARGVPQLGQPARMVEEIGVGYRVNRMFATHPPLEERIAALEAM